MASTTDRLTRRTTRMAMRHADVLVSVLSKKPYSGGWAIRLRDAFHNTVWIAGSAGNSGFVGAANSAITSSG